MPANGSLCSGWAFLQTRRSAKESGHSLEFNGPLQTREHFLLEIRRRWGLWADSAVDRDFTPLCYTITCMHLCCAEKAYSCSLEFCLGGFYNKWQLVFCPVLFLWPECVCVCVWSVSCVLFCVISLVIPNTQALNPICKSLNLRLTLSPRQYLLVIWPLTIVRRYPLSGVPQTQKNKKQSVLGTPSGLFQETCPHLCFIWSETEETSTRMSPSKFPPPCSCMVPSTAHWYFWPNSTVRHHSLTFM